jgi:DNA-directed RNA polymerase specialized sigma24 family protein
MYSINCQYKYAEKLVGPLARDLVHHTVVRLHDKNVDWSKVKYPNTYFNRVMIQELHERGDFWKLYGTGRELPQEPQEDPEVKLCAERCKAILVDLYSEGYRQEVEVFRRLVNGQSHRKCALDMRISRKSVAAASVFIKQEIQHRYGTIDD